MCTKIVVSIFYRWLSSSRGLYFFVHHVQRIVNISHRRTPFDTGTTVKVVDHSEFSSPSAREEKKLCNIIQIYKMHDQIKNIDGANQKQSEHMTIIGYRNI